LSKVTKYEACTGCGHDINKHYTSPIGVVRCLVVKRGESTKGVIGLPYEIDCPCSNYVVPAEANP
jgi:hypothetical protein